MPLSLERAALHLVRLGSLGLFIQESCLKCRQDWAGDGKAADSEAGTKTGLQLFLWKIIQLLIHNNTGMNCVSCAHSCRLTFRKTTLISKKFCVSRSWDSWVKTFHLPLTKWIGTKDNR